MIARDDPHRPRLDRANARADRALHPGDPGGGGERGGFRPGRLPARLQARAPAACRLVQDARRLHQPARRARSRPRASWRLPAAITAPRWPTRRCALRCAGAHLRAHRVLAGQDRAYPRATAPIWWWPVTATPTRWPRARPGPPSRGRCRCTPSTRRRRCSARARSRCELERQAPGLDTLLVAVGGGGLIGGHRRVVARAGRGHRCRARGRAHAHPGPRGGQAGGRARRRHRGGLARAPPGRAS